MISSNISKAHSKVTADQGVAKAGTSEVFVILGDLKLVICCSSDESSTGAS